MKLNKILRTIVIILAIILVAAISFVGIYAENKNQMSDVVKEYQLGRDLTGSRRIELELSNGTTTKKYDAEGKEIASDDTTTEVAKTEEIPANSEEVKTVENYKKAKEVIEKRLKAMKVEDYTIRLNEETGNIMLELPEDSNLTDAVASIITEQGKFEILDADTKEVLLTNADIEKVEAGIGSTSSGYSAYIGIQFNKEGTDKFANVSQTYVTVNETTNTTTNQTTDETAKDEETAKTTKKIELQIDGQTIMTDSFDQAVTNGLLQLTVGSASTTSNSEELQNYYTNAQTEAALLSNGSVPVVYTTAQNKYVYSDITIENLQIAIYVAIGVAVLAIIIMIVKHKKLGLLGGISLIGFTALLLLIIRYTNVELTISGLIAIALVTAIEYMIIWIMINNFKNIEDVKTSFVKTAQQVLKLIIPVIAIAVILSFSSHASIFSFGMTMFWGVVLYILHNLIVTRTLLVDARK